MQQTPATTGDSPAAAQAPQHEAALVFDGRGAEYFRIWIVHTLLNVITLGVYSPWAKVRKMRWFAQHTSLMSERFDYHGRPLPILLGRAVGLALFLAWSYAFEFSLVLGFVIFAMLCVLGPLLFSSAQRFRLANIGWRGLRFDFQVPRRALYMVCVPALLVWTLATLLQASGAPVWAVVSASIAASLSLPLAHARLKAMQHSHAQFAGAPFSFQSGVGAFYKLYLKAFGIVFGAGFVAGTSTYLIVRAFSAHGRPPVSQSLLVAGGTILLLWMLAWPYFAARMQSIVWPRTRWGGIGFRGEMRAGRLIALVVPGTLLTVATAGLYWPFLAVAIARYRVESIVLLADEPLENIELTASRAPSVRAFGDATADFFGLDLGW